LGSFLRCTRPNDVDIFCKLGAVRQNRHVIWRNINKSPMHRDVLHFAVSQVDACVVLDECTQKSCVTWKKRNFTAI
jgi:hypothetical protein